MGMGGFVYITCTHCGTVLKLVQLRNSAGILFYMGKFIVTTLVSLLSPILPNPIIIIIIYDTHQQEVQIQN